jgi:hypothetical protein
VEVWCEGGVGGRDVWNKGCVGEARVRRRRKKKAVRIFCHGSTNSKRRLLVKDQLRAMIFELEKGIHGSTTSIYTKSLCTDVVAVLHVAALL